MAAAGIGLAGCNVSDAPPSDETATTTASDTGVTREPMAAPEQAPVARMPAQAAIQSQPGPEGSQLDLLKVAVTGDILTVTLRCSSPEKYNSQSFNVDKISLIDDATSQRIGVLKDDKADWMASNVSGNNLSTQCGVKPGIIWAKFPAPPATSPTVSINLPKVAPFDGVPVTR
ncbi:MAG: hypothetical protein KKA44_15195 [Alphaproteobacteria bacterium]|nr:hypothetical protein [Alphaproteobacteria bacterium]MBU0865832.1 hypothetical protein [Alphaproteobacteria bacterium]MBU1826301.1 hypothetical protein [Alphaproteobacteria bacterium]